MTSFTLIRIKYSREGFLTPDERHSQKALFKDIHFTSPCLKRPISPLVWLVGYHWIQRKWRANDSQLPQLLRRQTGYSVKWRWRCLIGCKNWQPKPPDDDTERERSKKDGAGCSPLQKHRLIHHICEKARYFYDFSASMAFGFVLEVRHGLSERKWYTLPGFSTISPSSVWCHLQHLAKIVQLLYRWVQNFWTNLHGIYFYS